MTKEIEDLLGSRFIQRTDVKAIQRGDIYMPHENSSGERLPWNRAALREHINGEASYGHYLVDLDGNAKLFAFDIDLAQAKPDADPPKTYEWIGVEPDGSWTDMAPRDLDPRSAWAHPKCPDNLKRFLTANLMEAAGLLASAIEELVEVPVAVAYSGSKGVHVYGFTGTAPAADCRDAAREVMEFTGLFETIRGECFYGPIKRGAKDRFSCVEIEVFPKQANLEGKDLGNLMRLPLGNNLKGGRSYFLTLSENIDTMTEMDPVQALEGMNPWSR